MEVRDCDFVCVCRWACLFSLCTHALCVLSVIERVCVTHTDTDHLKTAIQGFYSHQ